MSRASVRTWFKKEANANNNNNSEEEEKKRTMQKLKLYWASDRDDAGRLGFDSMGPSRSRSPPGGDACATLATFKTAHINIAHILGAFFFSVREAGGE